MTSFPLARKVSPLFCGKPVTAQRENQKSTLFRGRKKATSLRNLRPWDGGNRTQVPLLKLRAGKVMNLKHCSCKPLIVKPMANFVNFMNILPQTHLKKWRALALNALVNGKGKRRTRRWVVTVASNRNLRPWFGAQLALGVNPLARAVARGPRITAPLNTASLLGNRLFAITVRPSFPRKELLSLMFLKMLRIGGHLPPSWG